MKKKLNQIEYLNTNVYWQVENKRKLYEELVRLVDALHIDSKVLTKLNSYNFTALESIEDMERGFKLLCNKIQQNLDPILRNLCAVSDKISRYQEIADLFSERLLRKIESEIKRFIISSKQDSKILKGSNINNHTKLFQTLIVYKNLVLQMKLNNQKQYKELVISYKKKIGTVYRKEMFDFLDSLRNNFTQKRYSSKSSSKENNAPELLIIKKNIDKIVLSTEKKLSIEQSFGYFMKKSFEIVVEESIFCMEFLGLKCTDLKDTLFDGLYHNLETFLEICLKDSSNGGIGLGVLIESFEDDKNELILSMTKTLMDDIDNHYDVFVNVQIKLARDEEQSLMKKSNLFVFVSILSSLIIRIDNLLQHSKENGRIQHIARSRYKGIMNALFTQLVESEKSLETMTKKNLLTYFISQISNNHYLIENLGKLKVESIDKYVKMFTSKYNSFLSEYCQASVRGVYGRLQEFCESLNSHIHDRGIKSIHANQIYNTSSARSIVRKHTEKEIRDEIDNTYRRVDKHFSNEQNLSSHIKEKIKSNLISKYNFFKKILSSCYSSSDIRLLFDIHKIL